MVSHLAVTGLRSLPVCVLAAALRLAHQAVLDRFAGTTRASRDNKRAARGVQMMLSELTFTSGKTQPAAAAAATSAASSQGEGNPDSSNDSAAAPRKRCCDN